MTVCAGVDGCRGGWIAVWRHPGAEPTVAVFETFGDLLKELPDDAIIAVDIPIGLPDRIQGKGRIAEQTVRPLLAGKASSVFSVPSRETIESGMKFHAGYRSGIHSYVHAYELAKKVARSTSDPAKSLSRQAFGILPKIAEVDANLRADSSLPLRVFESHPEMAFRLLNGGMPMSHSKLTDAGAAERRAALIACGLDEAFLHQPAPKRAKTDDLIDACAMLLIAGRIRNGDATSHPSPPGRDGLDLPIAIWV